MATFSNMISVFFLVFFVSIASSNPTSGNDMVTTLSQSINHFSEDFNKVVSQDQHNAGKNLVLSPITANVLLAWMSLSAKEETQKKVNAGLYLPNSDSTNAAYKATIDKMNGPLQANLKTYTKVYISAALPKTPYSASTKSAVNFGIEVEIIDFAESVEAAAEINNWVEAHTNGTVGDIIDPEDLQTNTGLVAVNAFSFKADFVKQFDPKWTWNSNFNVTKNKTIQLPTMHQIGIFLYKKTNVSQILVLGLEDLEYSMVITLPNNPNKTLDSYELPSLGDNTFVPTEVIVCLPKFHIETINNIKSAAGKLGMGNLFTDQGGVTKAIQKTVINVDEKGVSAAAASGQVLQNLPPSLKSNVVLFKADHPFQYDLINKHGILLLSGKFTGEN